MRLARIKLRNFRCHRENTEIAVGNLTAIIGKNDAGKSSILDALKIFFDDSAPDCDDATNTGDKGDCRIVCEFDDLPAALVIDADFQTTLADEYLLNGLGRLEIHKVFNCDLAKPKLKGVFANAIHPSAEGYADLLALKNAALKKRATELDVNTDDVDLTKNAEIRRAIWSQADNLQLALQEVPLAAEGAKQIWEQLAKQMPIFQLFKSDRPSTDQDEEAQDPMKAAVREALKKKEAELEALAAEVQEEVKAIAEETVKKIADMDEALAKELHPQFQSPKWDSVFKISLTDNDQIPVNKRGSGVRRLILLNFFRARAERQLAEKQACGIIYAIEEPETSQHPNCQQMLMRALTELAEQPGCQVLITTHTPTLARLLPIETLRYIECHENGGRTIHQGDGENTARLVADALGVLPDHDVKLFIGVEGINDISFLHNISRILNEAGEDLPNLEALEAEGTIIFVPLGGQSLERWVGRLAGLNRPEFHLFDREEEPPAQPKYHATVTAINDQPNCRAYSTTKLTLESYLHPDAIAEARPGVVLNFGEFDDVPKMAAKCIHDAAPEANPWEQLEHRLIKSKVGTAKKWLNCDAVQRMTAARLTVSDPAGDIRGWLTEIKALIEA